jgi:carboxyl-terminal processing protease
MKKLVRLLVFVSFALTSSCYAKTSNQTSQPIKLTQDVHHATAIDRIVSRLSHSHYLRFKLDDAFSEKLFDEYIDQLDSKRILFLESDIQRFSASRTRLDDELRSGQIDTAYDLFRLVQQRYKEQTAYSLTLLDTPMVFDGNDIIQLDRSQLPRPTTKEEQKILWYSLVKNDAINLKLSGKDWREIKTILTKRYQTAQRQLEQSNSEDVFNVFINSFTAMLDPHTNYLSPSDTANFITLMNLSLEGIGATLQQSDGYIQIASLVPNGPAAKSNQLSVGDKIIGVGQGNKAIVDIIGWRLDDAITLIKGPKGSKVRLEILPKKSKKSKIVVLTREEIKFEDSKAKKEIKQINGKSVAVLTIPSFYIGVAQDTEILLKELSLANVDALVVDLRMNGGGALLEVIQLSDLFIPSSSDSPIVQVKTSDGRVKAYSKNNTKGGGLNLNFLGLSKNKKYYYNKPMVVLVDRLSVSASEIFAAAMQDYGRAVIIGETTFGKGTVQDSVPLGRIYDGIISPNWKPFGSLRYTNQKFYRISGGSTQLKGVEPDLSMTSLTREVSDFGEKFEKNALPWDKIKKANYTKLKGIDALTPELKKRHEKRLNDSPDYQFILQYIERYKSTKKNQRTLSLNFAQREKEANSDEKIVVDYVNSQLRLLGKKPVSSLDDLPKDYQLPDTYLDEAILIALDLAELQRSTPLS